MSTGTTAGATPGRGPRDIDDGSTDGRPWALPQEGRIPVADQWGQVIGWWDGMPLDDPEDIPVGGGIGRSGGVFPIPSGPGGAARSADPAVSAALAQLVQSASGFEPSGLEDARRRASLEATQDLQAALRPDRRRGGSWGTEP